MMLTGRHAQSYRCFDAGLRYSEHATVSHIKRFIFRYMWPGIYMEWQGHETAQFAGVFTGSLRCWPWVIATHVEALTTSRVRGEVTLNILLGCIKTQCFSDH